MPIVATHILLVPPLAVVVLLLQPAATSAPSAVAAMITVPLMDTSPNFSLGMLQRLGS
jgi:hypothetical protein